MAITERDKLNLEHFGCTFKEREGVFYVDWRGKSLSKGSKGDIFACLGKVDTEVGPVLLLAFEISAVRPLPHFCYFPFDLTNEAHSRFLSNFTQTGEIKLCLFAGSRTVERTHQLSPYLQLRATEQYEEAVQNLAKHGRSAYDFEGAVRELERWVRIPQFLDHFFSVDDLAEMTKRVEKAVQLVPNERREAARRIVGETMETFRPFYENNRKAVLENIRRIRAGLLFLLDTNRLFVGNSRGLAELLADGIASSFSPEDLENLDALATILVSLPTVLSTLLSTSEAEPELPAEFSLPRVPAGVPELIQSMAARKFGFESVKKLFELLGLEVGGKAGRRPRDYSREYDWKVSGKSWRQVTMLSLQENPETREEFGGRDFDSLKYEQQEALMNRIRQGVKSYAERAGKSLPVAYSPSLSLLRLRISKKSVRNNTG